MNYIKQALAIAMLFFIFNNGKAQSPEEALDNIRNNYAAEKIYIQYDKATYVAGETVWFKAYFLSGFLPSQLSSSVSIDLLNDSGKVIDRKILPIMNSTAEGNFDLPKELPQMNYTIRAYTRRLMNFGTASFYYQQIAVYNPSSPPKQAVPAKQYHLYFFPESGNFIAGISNVVAFKCTDQWGFPADATGVVVNSAGDTITTFHSVHDGMGEFGMIPKTGETYSALSTIENTAHEKTALPAAIAAGASLSIQRTGDNTFFLVNSETVFNEIYRPAYILGVMENTVIFKTMLPPGQNFKGIIPVADIPGGIMQVTIFNHNNQPLAERLIFINNKDYIAAGAFNTDTLSTADRAKNVYSFELQDSLFGSYAVSVTDAERSIVQSIPDNIASHFLITNDIKGYVHEPGYYFQNIDAERMKNLDLVMLTNGWRKFSWNEILAKRFPPMTYKDANYINLSGLAYNAETTKPLPETSLGVFVKTKDSVNDFMLVPVSSQGTFEITGMIFKDTATMYIENMVNKNKRTVVQQNNLSISSMFNIASPAFSVPVKPLIINGEEEKVKSRFGSALAEFRNKTILLNEIRLKSTAKSQIRMLEERYIRNGLFNSYSAKTLDLLNDPIAASSSTNIFEYLKGRLSSVTISGSGGNYFVNFRQTMSLSSGPVPMSIFLDEMPLSSTLEAATIPVSQIAMVKVYSTGFVGAEGSGPGGALAIYTKKGDDSYNVPGMNNLFRLKVEGYSLVKEFFSPDYSTGMQPPTGADYRSTIYWNSSLRTDPSNKKISFSFYNADQVKKLKVVLEGMTADGKLVHVEKIIE